MSKSFFKKIGITLLVVASVGFITLKVNSSKDITESTVDIEVSDEELENTYIDDGYETPEISDEVEDEIEDEIEKTEEDASDIVDSSIKEEISSSENNVDTSKDENLEKPATKNASFEGFADSNFIEIKIGNDYATYRVSDEAKKALSSKKLGDNITFETKTIDGQVVITSVK